MSEKIVDSLPEGPEREYVVKTFGPDADALKVTKSLMEMRSAASQRRVPEKDAPPEQWSQFHEFMGRPAKASDYKLPETTSALKPVLESLRDVAWSRGLSQDQFQALAAQAATVASEADAKTAAARKEWEASLRNTYGDKADKKLQTADSTFAKIMQDYPDAAAAIRNAGLERHPAIAQMLVRVGEAMGDDSAPIGGSAGASIGPTAQEIVASANKIEASEAYQNTNHPEHKAAHDRILEHILQLRSMGYSGRADQRLRQQRVLTMPDGTKVPVPEWAQ